MQTRYTLEEAEKILGTQVMKNKKQIAKLLLLFETNQQINQEEMGKVRQVEADVNETLKAITKYEKYVKEPHYNIAELEKLSDRFTTDAINSCQAGWGFTDSPHTEWWKDFVDFLKDRKKVEKILKEELDGTKRN